MAVETDCLLLKWVYRVDKKDKSRHKRQVSPPSRLISTPINKMVIKNQVAMKGMSF